MQEMYDNVRHITVQQMENQLYRIAVLPPENDLRIPLRKSRQSRRSRRVLTPLLGNCCCEVRPKKYWKRHVANMDFFQFAPNCLDEKHVPTYNYQHGTSKETRWDNAG